jgi:hypothetical protein
MGVDPIRGKSLLNHGPRKMRPLQQSRNEDNEEPEKGLAVWLILT